MTTPFSNLNDAYAGKLNSKTDLLPFAKMKAKLLLPECQVRLTAQNDNYYLINMGGRVMIGFFLAEPANKFFKNKPLFFIQDSKGNVIGQFQNL